MSAVAPSMQLAHRSAAKLSGARVGVYGLGASGAAAARLLTRLGATVRLFDDGRPDPARLSTLGLDRYPAPEAPGDLAGIDLLVVSPGIPPRAPGRLRAEERGIPALGELDLALGLPDLAEVLGGPGARTPRVMIVTGSHGKSTTTTLVAGMLEAAGTRAIACGNLGPPVAATRLDHPEAEVLVVEASSFQLHDATRFAADGAIFVAYAVNHLDWHPDEAHYRAAKLSFLSRMPAGAPVAYLPGFPGLEAAIAAAGLVGRRVDAGATTGLGWDRDHPGQVVLASGTVDLGNLPRGAVLAPLAPQFALAGALLQAFPQAVRDAALRFEPLPHRLQDAGSVDGRRFIDDSKATTPAAAAYSVGRIQGPVVLILGGKDKGLSFGDHRSAFARAAAIVATGAAAGRIEGELRGLPLEVVPKFEEAVRRAHALAPEGGTVLLAPGCSSFDAFRSFEERGECFRRTVCALGQEAPRRA